MSHCYQRKSRRWVSRRMPRCHAAAVGRKRERFTFWPIWRLNWPSCASIYCGAQVMLDLDLARLRRDIARHERFRTSGVLRSATGLLLSCSLPAAVGDQCAIDTGDGTSLLAEAIGFQNGMAFLVPYEHAEDVHSGMRVTHLGRGLIAPVGEGLLGRIVDGLSRPLDGRGPVRGCDQQPVQRS